MTVTPETSGRQWMVTSFLMPLVYVLWFLPMIALGYGVTALFDAYPSVSNAPELWDMGLLAKLADILYLLVCAWPSWVGIAMAVMGRKQGASLWVYLALAINLAIGVLIIASEFL
jgi:hypothetical protein